MPPKLQVEEAFVFLFQCIEASGCKMDFKVVGQATGLSPAAARMRYTRLKKAVDSGQFRGAAMHQPPAALIQSLNGITSMKSTEPIVDEDSDDEKSMDLARNPSRKRKFASGDLASEAEFDDSIPKLLHSQDKSIFIGKDGTSVLGGMVNISATSGHASGPDANREQLLNLSNKNQDNLGEATPTASMNPSKAVGRKAGTKKAAEAAYARTFIVGPSKKQSTFPGLSSLERDMEDSNIPEDASVANTVFTRNRSDQLSDGPEVVRSDGNVSRTALDVLGLKDPNRNGNCLGSQRLTNFWTK